MRSAPVKPRACRKCRQVKPFAEFPLLNDPVVRQRQWATRHWCGDCLVAGGHITTKRLQAFRAVNLDPTPPRAPRSTDPAARRAVREHRLTVELVDRADEVPAFAAALNLLSKSKRDPVLAAALDRAADSVALVAEYIEDDEPVNYLRASA